MNALVMKKFQLKKYSLSMMWKNLIHVILPAVDQICTIVVEIVHTPSTLQVNIFNDKSIIKVNTYIMFLFLACPENQIRFGDYCYEELSNQKQTIEENANQCEDKLGHLWYPESATEFVFVKNTFPVETSGDVYHLGFHEVYSNHGMYLIDRSYHPGITHYTVLADDTGKITGFGEHLIDSAKCKVYDPEADEILNTCSEGKGVCKFPLAVGQGYEVISDKIDYKISVPEKVDIPTEFGGMGHFHIEFLPSSATKTIDIKLASSIMLSGILVEMPLNRGAKQMKMLVLEQGIQYPDKWTLIWPKVFTYQTISYIQL